MEFKRYLEAACKDQLESMVRHGLQTLYVNYSELLLFFPNEDLLVKNFHVLLPEFERCLSQAISTPLSFPQISIFNFPRITPIRHSLYPQRQGFLTSISGQVTRVFPIHPELHCATFQCQEEGCGAKIRVVQRDGYTEPGYCTNEKCQNTNKWKIVSSDNQTIDHQKIKVQQAAHDMKGGIAPSIIDVILRGELVDRVKPGDRIVVTGYLELRQNRNVSSRQRAGAQISKDKGVQVGSRGLIMGGIGLKDVNFVPFFNASHLASIDAPQPLVGNVEDESGFWAGNAGLTKGIDFADRDVADREGKVDIITPQKVAESFSKRESDLVLAVARDINREKKIIGSFCPHIFGYEKVKLGIILQMLGGVSKVTPEGVPLRGDVNILLVGDPSVGKSKILKGAVDLLPRSVFTAGKSSSAAGLTASVVKDSESGEYTIEAGAMMLADGGICAIDEFEKMDEHDQVAIHEAMEQQTISITKAGIQASLNARTSVLAAMNPAYGNYDISRPLRSNVRISPPILSRFDLVFIMMDEHNRSIDNNIADAILHFHSKKHVKHETDVPYSQEQLRLFIRFARSFQPRITNSTRKLLNKHYTKLRMSGMDRGRVAFRYTIRQLESLVRLSEAFAKLRMSDRVEEKDVDRAVELVKEMNVKVNSGEIRLDEDGSVIGETQEEEEGEGREGREASGEEEDMLRHEGDVESSDSDLTAGEFVPRKKQSATTTTLSYDDFVYYSRIILLTLDLMRKGEELIDELKENDSYVSEVNAAVSRGEKIPVTENDLIKNVVSKLIRAGKIEDTTEIVETYRILALITKKMKIEDGTMVVLKDGGSLSTREVDVSDGVDIEGLFSE
ncbi:DNA replication licensing factor MCM6 [Aduncisulcus paluster]|uniref:DNA replication licensing factor MCM6 n=1 Tax=Aduncisulcus paluster TaxID=2918883 RepID=A0ABQ5K2B7_9EUKA|nr:DNA replication licensing factor MCM6 [Aduncisulcus paluster]